MIYDIGLQRFKDWKIRVCDKNLFSFNYTVNVGKWYFKDFLKSLFYLLNCCMLCFVSKNNWKETRKKWNTQLLHSLFFRFDIHRSWRAHFVRFFLIVQNKTKNFVRSQINRSLFIYFVHFLAERSFSKSFV